MSVNEKEAKIFPITLDDLLCAVSMFSNGFAGFTTKLKSQLVIADVFLDIAQAYLQIHKYDLDLEVELPPPWSTASFRASIFFPSTQACAEFVETTVKNEAKYEETAQIEESEITKHRIWKVVDFLYHIEFPPHEFKLDRMRAPVLDPDVADASGLRYRKLSMHIKQNFT